MSIMEKMLTIIVAVNNISGSDIRNILVSVFRKYSDNMNFYSYKLT